MGDERLPGEVGALKDIYRVNSGVGDTGLRSLEEAMSAAYCRTQSQLAVSPELQGLFYPRFLEGYRDFDELVPGFLKQIHPKPSPGKLKRQPAWQQSTTTTN